MKNKVIYKCSKCDYESPKWFGRCQQCDSWDTSQAVEVNHNKGSRNRDYSNQKKSIKLSQIKSSNSDRIVTSLNEFNRVMGGGIVKDSITIVTAKPGAGKSTLLLQVANDVATKGFRVLYATGEESESQIKNRADRILGRIHANIWVISDNSMNNVLSAIKDIDPDIIIVDSIQTFVLDEFAGSRAGSPTQTMECASELLRVAKNFERPRAIINVGQMTKADEIAGLRALEHLVDTVLILEGESGEQLREAWCSKNRFGSTGEICFFIMTEQGMESVDNPSEFFMTQRDNGEKVSGSALTVIKEGSRPIVVEIESLVSKSYTPYPSRIGECLKRDQLSTLTSILEERGKIGLYDKNIVIKTTGGIQLKEQGANLAIIMSIVSSVKDVAIPSDVAFIADVGLTGELKKVPAIEVRIRELARMGYKQVYIAKGSLKDSAKFNEDIRVIELRTLIEVISHILKEGH